MEVINVILAAAAGYAFGAFWYMKWAKEWVAASGIAVDPDGKPANKSAMPFIIAGVAMLVVAGMMRHVFSMAGIDTIAGGLVSGFGFGAFIALPWIVTNYAYSDRPKELTYIDGGYAVFGSTIIGTVLALF